MESYFRVDPTWETHAIRTTIMPLVTIQELSIRFRGPPLLRAVNCQIEAGQRIGLLGRNGSGKTTLMRILLGEIEPDAGDVTIGSGVRISLLPQDVPQQVDGTIAKVVEQGLLAPNGRLAEADWKAEHRVERILSRVGLEADAPFDTLSSGMKRRVLLAQTLVSEPDLLLLDEPTNHLDIDTITWLENFLARWDTTLVFVTHDRLFLRKLATRILEIDQGQLFDWSCDYDTFLSRKQAALASQQKSDALFDKKLAEEEVWIRRGIKARRTRNEGRVRALEKMRLQRRERSRASGNVKIQIDQGQRSGNLVVDVDAVSFSYGDDLIIPDFSTTIMRGDKVGIIGRNGAGKTTLLQLLLGKLVPAQGGVRLGTNLQIAYFDQLRVQLDGNLSVQENVGDGYDTVQVGGLTRHIIGYLQDFLFTPERARTPIRFLSGGERNRVLLAKLFAKPANVVVLDEPTNDLDAETLELLEERLVEYEGTVFLVSHDRAFLNNIVTSTIVFEEGVVREYVGGYDDWQRVRANRAANAALLASKGQSGAQSLAAKRSKPGTAEANGPPLANGKRRLSYKEQQELASLPTAIDALESEISQIHESMAAPTYYQRPGREISSEQARLKQLETQLAAAYGRWELLDE